ncbi:MAG: glutathione S-transferase [Alteromonadaceae bacterium]|jgi:glutathione S-transferase
MITPKNTTLYIQELGPFPQAAMITFLEKGLKVGVDFNVEIINIKNKSASFIALSPTGKPPLLEVNGIPIFETAVIIEAIDNLYGTSGQFQLSDTLLKMENKSWTAFGLMLLNDVFNTIMQTEEQNYILFFNKAQENFFKLEERMGLGPYFNGSEVSLIDFVYSTLFLRQEVFERHYNLRMLDNCPKLRKWSEVLLARESTTASLPDHFEKGLTSWLNSSNLYLSNN